MRNELGAVDHGAGFVDRCEEVSRHFWDIAFKHVRLQDAAGMMLGTLVELAGRGAPALTVGSDAGEERSDRLMSRLRASVGPDREAEAANVVETARVSWRLRDDDNVLLARIESQLLRALEMAADRLRAVERLSDTRQLDERDAPTISRALHAVQPGLVELPAADPAPTPPADAERDADDERIRQLVGQPASVGLATGRARHVRGAA